MLFPVENVFDYRYEAEILLHNIYGGIPANPKVVEGWIRRAMGGLEGETTSDDLRRMVVNTLIERHQGEIEGLRSMDEETLIEAIKEVADLTINGFKRTEAGELYIEGRQVQAMLKEAANVSVAAGDFKARGWGKTNKGLMSFLPEHMVVPELIIPLGVTEPTGVDMNFVHTWQGSSIKREEYVENAKVRFTVLTDWDFGNDFWTSVLTRAQVLGLGASRSQTRGRFEFLRWDRIA